MSNKQRDSFSNTYTPAIKSKVEPTHCFSNVCKQRDVNLNFKQMRMQMNVCILVAAKLAVFLYGSQSLIYSLSCEVL